MVHPHKLTTIPVTYQAHDCWAVTQPVIVYLLLSTAQSAPPYPGQNDLTYHRGLEKGGEQEKAEKVKAQRQAVASFSMEATFLVV